MNNTNYVQVGSPEYFILKHKVKFLRTMDIPLDKLKHQFKEMYALNQKVMDGLFTINNRVYTGSYWANSKYQSAFDMELYKQFKKEAVLPNLLGKSDDHVDAIRGIRPDWFSVDD
jgi:hypothetical protein